MEKLYRFTGWIGIILSPLAALSLMYHNPLGALLILFFGVVISMALISLAEVVEYMDHLKAETNIHLPHSPGNLDVILPQVTCTNCGNAHDFDYPKCPSCGQVKA